MIAGEADDPVRAALARDARRIVVKLGTNVVLDANGRPAVERLRGIIASVAALRAAGRQVVLVTSGAVGLGAARLGGGGRQACAAVGQGRLVAFYHDAFAGRGVEVAQLLLTAADLTGPARARRLAATLDALLRKGVVPVLNENDAVGPDAVEGGGGRGFRDNDMLAALVARATGASLLVLLSDVDGVYTGDPAIAADAALIPTLRRVPATLLRGAARPGARGRGGMAAKLRAARRASTAGIGVVIANGHRADVLARILDGEREGTLLTRGAP